MKKGLLSILLVGWLLTPVLSARIVHHKMLYRSIGIASWYGGSEQGKKMANGKRFDKHKLTCASRWYPLGSKLRVTNLSNGLTTVVIVTDRGPRKLSRIIDLSEVSARQIDCIKPGLCKVLVTKV